MSPLCFIHHCSDNGVEKSLASCSILTARMANFVLNANDGEQTGMFTNKWPCWICRQRSQQCGVGAGRGLWPDKQPRPARPPTPGPRRADARNTKHRLRPAFWAPNTCRVLRTIHSPHHSHIHGHTEALRNNRDKVRGMTQGGKTSSETLGKPCWSKAAHLIYDSIARMATGETFQGGNEFETA